MRTMNGLCASRSGPSNHAMPDLQARWRVGGLGGRLEGEAHKDGNLDLEVCLPRRPCCKRVEEMPGVSYFKPRAVPLAVLKEVVLGVDELEALRLAHREGLYQQDAATRMGVSRATFGRVLDAAHRKVTESLLDGCALRIEGGAFRLIGPGACDACPVRERLDQGEDVCGACDVRREGRVVTPGAR